MSIAALVQQYCETTVKLSVPAEGLSVEELADPRLRRSLSLSPEHTARAGARLAGSPRLVGQGIALAARIPYRQAADLLGTFVDEWIDHRTLYRWVEETSEAIVQEEDDLQHNCPSILWGAVFQEAIVLPEPTEQREPNLAEVDATFLRA